MTLPFIVFTLQHNPLLVTLPYISAHKSMKTLTLRNPLWTKAFMTQIFEVHPVPNNLNQVKKMDKPFKFFMVKVGDC